MEGERGRKESNWLGLEIGAVDEAAKQAQKDRESKREIRGQNRQTRHQRGKFASAHMGYKEAE